MTFLTLFNAILLLVLNYSTQFLKENSYVRNKTQPLSVISNNQQHEYLLNFELQEQFVLNYNDKMCSVIDLATNTEVYTCNDFVYPYLDNNSFHIFNNSFETSICFLCSDGEYVWEPSNYECRVSLSECFNGISDFTESNSGITSIPAYANRIDDYEYYLSLDSRHSRNINNLCTLISIQMLVSYYDAFLSDSFVPEEWDYLSKDNVYDGTDWHNWSFSSGAGYQDLYEQNDDFRMCQYLLSYAQSYINNNITNNGLNYSQQRDLLNYYLGQMSISYSLNTSAGNIVDCLNNKAKTVIENSIDNNYPVIANGRHHSVVAFAYDDDYVYVHTGCGYCSQVVWETFTDWNISYTPSAISVIPSIFHSHSNNYYSTYDDKFYCTCGLEMYGNYTDNSSLTLPYVPSDILGTIYYNTGFNATFYYLNVYRNSLDQIVFNEDSELFISFNCPVYGLMLRGLSFHSESVLPSIIVEFLDSNYISLYSYNLITYTDFKRSGEDVEVALNSSSQTRHISIRIETNNSTNVELTIKKLVFALF